MKHSLLGGLTVAVAMSVIGAPLPSQAQDASEKALSLDAESEQHADTHVLPTLQPDTGLLIDPISPSAEPNQLESAPLPHTAEESSEIFDIAAVYPHALDTRQAATVYLRSIPVITLVGDPLETLSASSSPAAVAPTYEAPQQRANEVLARLQSLAVDGDASNIEARWNNDDKTFEVAWGDEYLVTIDDQTMLPDTTSNPSEDALQIANRLRRLLGDAPPLARIEGLPEPAAPANRVGIVTSTLSGVASWYGPGFHGRRSASGEVFNQNALTAAHRTLPFGTQVRVTNLSTGRSVVVRINDRGPFGHGRVIDLSAAAAAQIGLQASGVGRVQLEVLSAQ